MHCGDQYPDKPPEIQFISEINLPCVNPRNGQVSTGLRTVIMSTCPAEGFHVTALTVFQVDPSKLPCLAQWKREYTMETVLIELRR